MPLDPRLDAPGALHQVMVRSLERHEIFRDDRGRLGFVQRLAALTEGGHLNRRRLCPPQHQTLVRRSGPCRPFPLPRGPRLDAPGTLHHVRVRGIERTAIFGGRRDRSDCVNWNPPFPTLGQSVVAARRGEVTALVRAVLGRGR
jgi:hypothetical protein